jgi:cytosine/adenosine deaminase-related metal-dependent hydrolase
MNSSARHTLRARYVFPIAGPPIADGTVTIDGGRIVAVGPGKKPGEGVRSLLPERPGGCCAQKAPDPFSAIEDLGNVAILPGLVNAHVHLDLSDVRAPLGSPGMGLVDWIRLVMAHRGRSTTPRPAAIAMGLQESLALGTITLADISQPNSPADVYREAACDVTMLLELIAPTAQRVAAAVDLARRHLQEKGSGAFCAQHPPGRSGKRLLTPLSRGLCPHAPYTVQPGLLRQAVALSADHHAVLAFHLAESREEIEWLRTGGGPFRALLESLGAWDPTLSEPGSTPLDYLQLLARADRALVIHGNYLAEEEIAFLAGHAQRMAVVYCPRTHAWFGHPPYPLEKLLEAGVTVALGTDSRASAADLSLLAEMRAVARSHPQVPPATILRLGTLAGARALGRDADVGSLEPGKWANLAVIELPAATAADPHELLLGSDRPVVETWLGGRRLYVRPVAAL